jgi:hypothetical protein
MSSSITAVGPIGICPGLGVLSEFPTRDGVTAASIAVRRQDRTCGLKRRPSVYMPAPIIEPTTSADNENTDISVEAAIPPFQLFTPQEGAS